MPIPSSRPSPLTMTVAGTLLPSLEGALAACGLATEPLGPEGAADIILMGVPADPGALEELRASHPDAVIVVATAGRADTGRWLDAGADDVFTPEDDPGRVRARLALLQELAALRAARRRGAALQEASEAQIAAYAAQLEASEQNLRVLYDELEDHARALQTLVTAQETLIGCQVPEDIVGHVRSTLEALFPGAGVLVEVEETPGAPGVRTVEPAGADRWTSATLPLAVRGQALGRVRVSAPEGDAYDPRRLDLLEVFAGQAAQALHRSRLYQALSLGKAEWERTFDAIPDTIAILEPDYTVRRVNRALAATAGLEPREIIGRRCFQLLYGRTGPCEGCPVTRVFETGEEVRTEREIRKGGRTFACRAYPLRDPSGRLVAAIAYARDITREKELARTLERNEKLMTLGQIAAGIAHEINNPLTAVSAYAQLLTLRSDDPKAAESARRIQQGVERIHRLVRNLMSFVRPRSEDVYPVDLNDVVADALSFSRYEVTRGSTRLVEDLADGLPKVLGSKDQLEQVLINLLTNARDAVAGRGTVTVRTRAENGRVLLEVVDDGPGIAPGYIDRIFEPFFTTKPPGKGTGLGLFVAEGIARRHGGSVTVESEPGRGTRAVLSLPAFEA